MTASESTAVDRLTDLVRSAPISYHAAAEVAALAQQAGFDLLDERSDWPDAPGSYVVVRDGAVIAWRRPEAASPASPFTEAKLLLIVMEPVTAPRNFVMASDAMVELIDMTAG